MMSLVGAFERRFSAGFALRLGLVAVCLSWPGAGLAQSRLVDPDKVAPEYREAAEKRRAEQLKLNQCSKKADDAKVLRRDRLAFINECINKNQ